MLRLYSVGPSMFSGDEDDGEMGAWFVLSALGLYELEQGGDVYVLGSPLFRKVVVSLPDGRTIQIEAEDNGKCCPYVTAATWWSADSKTEVGSAADSSASFEQLLRPELQYSKLMKGGILQFSMASEPTHSSGV